MRRSRISVVALPLVLPLIIAALCPAQTLPAFRWIKELDASGVDLFASLGTDSQGNIYVAGSTSSATFPVLNAAQPHLASSGGHNAFVAKLDPSGDLLYSTYFGGSGDDLVVAMAVDPAGHVSVTGSTSSPNFPTTPGTYATTTPSLAPYTSTSFLFRLNPDGSLAWSTYFPASSSTVNAIALDSTGTVYLSGYTSGGLPVTPGAYQSTCACGATSNGFFSIPFTDAFLTRFDARGSKLLFSTYLGVPGAAARALAIAPDASAYIGSTNVFGYSGPSDGIFHLDSSGSTLLGQVSLPLDDNGAAAMALAPDGSLYFAAAFFSLGPSAFTPPPGGFQPGPGPGFTLPYQGNGNSPATAVIHLDPTLQTILAGTYFDSPYGNSIDTLALGSAGNVYIGGYTSPRSLPTRTPLAQGFSYSVPGEGLTQTGFVAELTGDLSTLTFSSFFGDNETFGVGSLAVSPDGSVILGGMTASPNNVWINSLSITPPPALRLDAIENAASHLTDAISPGETILVTGAGFTPGAQLQIDGVAVSPLTVTSSAINAVVPPTLSGTYAAVQVTSGGALSNQVLSAVTPASPGLFSADSTGTGQGYILNADGTLNTPANPAATGSRITIYATGVGPLSFTDGYAVTQYPVSVFIDGFYCNGVSAVAGPVAGFPGNVYQLTVYVPNPADLIANNPDLKNFTFPLLDGIQLRIDNNLSQYGLAISIAP